MSTHHVDAQTGRAPGRAPGQAPGRRPQGFTLVEMVVTLVLFGLIAVSLTMFFRPAFDTWMATRSRSGMTAEAANAMRIMLRDVRAAVPNSIRSPGTSCFELVPTKAGGRYRMAVDTVHGGSVAVDPAGTTTSFDVLSPLSATPVPGDWLVVDNQNPGDVYSGVNRSAITALSTPLASAGRHRLAIAALQFPLGYDGGRFNVVDKDEAAVFYICSGASSTLDGNGDAPGVLYRRSGYGFNASAPASCPAVGGAAVVATGLRACSFHYTANQGATQQSGFISLQLEFTRNGETSSLVTGAHVVNVP
jgi:MSHA biogenesis protein MshO